MRGGWAMTTDPYGFREPGDGDEDDAAFDELGIPSQPRLQRCGAVHCIAYGPWTGTLVCCMRKGGHDGDHIMKLGDTGTSEYWQEVWR